MIAIADFFVSQLESAFGIRHSAIGNWQLAIGNWQSLVRRRVILRVRNSTPFISLTLTNAE